MNITVHTDPAWGASHATVHDELGQTVARFYGEHCVFNAQLYVDSFRARAALAELQATETRIETGNGRTTLRAWRAGKPYEVSAAGTDTGLVATLAGNMRRLMAVPA